MITRGLASGLIVTRGMGLTVGSIAIPEEDLFPKRRKQVLDEEGELIALALLILRD